jgi:Gluconate 2-dehydrogenase subunit 3
VLVCCSAVAGTLRTRGYALEPGRRLVVLAPWEFIVVQHAARRIAAPDVPGAGGSAPAADEVDVAGFVDVWVARMHRGLRRDVGRLLVFIEHFAPLTIGFTSRFTRLDAAEQDRVLASVESSSSDIVRSCFEGLKALVFMGYYRDPRTWRIVGYDGPLVGRPARGWE